MHRRRIKITVWRLVSIFVFQFESIVEIFSYYNIEFRLYIYLSLSSLQWRPTQLHLRGRGGAKKWGTSIPVYNRHTHSKHIFQFTVDIHFQNALLLHLSLLLCSLLLPKLRRLALCVFIYFPSSPVYIHDLDITQYETSGIHAWNVGRIAAPQQHKADNRPLVTLLFQELSHSVTIRQLSHCLFVGNWSKFCCLDGLPDANHLQIGEEMLGAGLNSLLHSWNSTSITVIFHYHHLFWKSSFLPYAARVERLPQCEVFDWVLEKVEGISWPSLLSIQH